MTTGMRYQRLDEFDEDDLPYVEYVRAMSKARRYAKEIESQFNWAGLARDCDQNYADAVEKHGQEWADNQAEYGQSCRSAYLGNCLSLSPSGKYYTPFACSNVSVAEALEDAAWYDALDYVAERHGLYVECGEGDPTDLFVVKGD